MERKAKIDGKSVEIVWDDNDIQSFYPDIVQVKASPNEFMLLFGDMDKSHSDRDVRHAKLTERIVLNPFVAKRFAIQLFQGIRSYETKYGLLKREPRISTRLEPTPPLQPPRFKSAEGSGAVALVFAFLEAQGIRPAFERSFKFKHNHLHKNRFLLGFEKDGIRDRPDEKLVGICRKMEMPPDFLEEYKANLPESNIVGFGFGEDEKGCVARAYLEFGGRFFRAVRSNPQNPDPYLSHMGFKWDTEDNNRKALTRYTCHPRYTVDKIISRLENDFYPKNVVRPIEILKSFLSAACERIGSRRFLFLEVTEEDGPRVSFDINFYPANIHLKEIHSSLRDVFQYFGLDDRQYKEFYEQAKENIVGHLAGGTDRDGRDFLTIYTGE